MSRTDKRGAEAFEKYLTGAISSEAFFSHLYDIAQTPLLTYIRKKHWHLSAEDSEDVAQEALIRLMRQIIKENKPDLRQRSMMGYLFITATNFVNDWLRSSATERDGTGWLVREVTLDEQIDHHLDAAPDILLRDAVEKVMAKLTIRQKTVLDLKFEDHLTHDEVAERLNIPATTVAHEIRMIRKAFREDRR